MKKVLISIGGLLVFVALLKITAPPNIPSPDAAGSSAKPIPGLTVDCTRFAQFSSCANGLGATAGIVLGDAMGCNADVNDIDRFSARIAQLLHATGAIGREMDGALAAMRNATDAAMARRQAGRAAGTCADAKANLRTAMGM